MSKNFEIHYKVSRRFKGINKDINSLRRIHTNIKSAILAYSESCETPRMDYFAKIFSQNATSYMFERALNEPLSNTSNNRTWFNMEEK